MERVLMAMQGGKVDRRPVTLTLSLYGARLTSCPLKEYYTNPRAYLAGQLAVIEQCRPDIVFTPFVLAAEAEAFGSEVVYIDKNPPNLKKTAITSAGSISALPEPDIGSHPRLLYIREATRLLAASCQGKRPVAAMLLSPMDLPSLIMGMEGWLDTILFDPENTRLMLDKTVKYFIDWANTLFADGATVLVMPSMFTSPSILTRKIVEESVIPVLAEAFQEIKGPLVFHHGGNPIGKFMELYSPLPNVAGFLLDNRDSFAEARKTIGPGKVLFGNINGPNLWRLKPETIRTVCRKLLEERKGDDHFIMATSGADVAFDTPVENIVAMIETVEAFG
jgi:uroporphyrinogen decarboxylase